MKHQLRDFVEIQTKSKIKAGEGQTGGKYKFFTSSTIQSKWIDSFQYDRTALIFGTGGIPNVHYCDTPFSTSTDCIVMYAKLNANLEVIYNYLIENIYLLEKGFRGIGLKHISKEYLLNLEIPILEKKIQDKIVSVSSIIKVMIANRKKQIEKLDELVKSRFIEMFGNLFINNMNWIVDTLGNYMITLTDFSANGSYALLDSNVIMYDAPNYAVMVRTIDLENGDLTNNVKYIDKNAYELLSKSKLFGGELIMNKIGSAGKVYIMPPINRPASLGRNAFMFRFDERLNLIYLYHLLTSEYGTNEIQQYVRGAVTKTITKEATRSIKILVPPIDLQNQFAAFVGQVEKSKAETQKSLEKLDLLKKALMQKYFG